MAWKSRFSKFTPAISNACTGEFLTSSSCVSSRISISSAHSTRILLHLSHFLFQLYSPFINIFLWIKCHPFLFQFFYLSSIFYHNLNSFSFALEYVTSSSTSVLLISLGFFYCVVLGNSVIATSGVLIGDQLLIDYKTMFSIEIMSSVFSRHRKRAFTWKSS